MTRNTQYKSVNVVRLFMKIIGLWYVETKREQLLLHLAFGYAVWAIVFAICVEGTDLYYSINDISALVSNMCLMLLLILILVKLCSFMYYRDTVMELIHFAEVKFWNVTYDEIGTRIMKKYDKLGMAATYTFTIIVSVASFNYIFAPVLEKQAVNGTDKILPFKLYLEFPYRSPYYEITYVIQSLSTIHSGICTICFDIFVSTFNIHIAAQLKILAYKVKTVVEQYIESMTGNKCLLETEAAVLTLKNLRSCVQEHLMLISYVRNMCHVYSFILLAQLLLSSVAICFGGFQFIITDTLFRKCNSGLYFMGSFIQLFIYAWTCNDIIVQSAAISDAAFESKWYFLPGNGPGKALRQGLIMIMIRTLRPCTLTAGHFAVMSLNTFMGILSTAMSYFTLLRQMSGNDI